MPFECPRCIRSFAAKHTLTRHLQRSHLVDTIIEMQAPQLTTSSALTTTTTTATTTLPLNTGEADVNNASEANNDKNNQGDGEGVGVDKCGKRVNSVARMNSNSNSKYAQHMPTLLRHQQQQQLELHRQMQQHHVGNKHLHLMFNDDFQQ